MPSRIIREGILESERVQKLVELGGWEAETFYRRLHQIVDDYGRYSADPKVLRPRMYPLALEQMREANVSRCLKWSEAAGLVRLYSVNARQYLEVVDFNQRTRSDSKCPAPPAEDLTVMRQTSAGHVRAYAESNAHAHAKDPPGFALFWAAWPRHERKVGKSKCQAKWRNAKLEPIADRVIAALERAKVSAGWTKKRGEYIPQPHSWLNDTPWETDPAEQVSDGEDAAHPDGFVPVRPDDATLDEVLGKGGKQ